MLTAIRTLDDLLHVLSTEPDSHETADRYGLPRDRHADAIDWTDLPTFGGEAPSNTDGVWSWDATRLLVTSAPLAGLEYGNALRGATTGLKIVLRDR